MAQLLNRVHDMDIPIFANRGFSQKLKPRMANSVDPDGTARYEPSHLDLHCLHRYICVCWDERVKP